MDGCGCVIITVARALRVYNFMWLRAFLSSFGEGLIALW